MNHRRNEYHDSSNLVAFLTNLPMQDWLDLLCEDGFLSSAEIVAAKETAKKQLGLIRRSMCRGFLKISENAENHGCRPLLARIFSLLCVWKNLTHQDIRLRSPPVESL